MGERAFLEGFRLAARLVSLGLVCTALILSAWMFAAVVTGLAVALDQGMRFVFAIGEGARQ